MKTALFCVASFLLGAVIGGFVVGNRMKEMIQRQLAMTFAADVVVASIQAEQMKLGLGDIVLRTMEEGFPGRVIFIHENEIFKGEPAADTALMAVKRFYVCTKTAIPESIATVMSEIALAEDACPEPDSE